MAVAFDAASTQAIGAGHLSWTHTPVGTPRGVLVFVLGNGAGDDVSTITYGSATLAEIPGSPNIQSVGEGFDIHAFFLGASVPTGAQTVFVNVTGFAAHAAVAITLTAGNDTALVDSDGTINSTSYTNPSVTLSLGGVTSFAAIGFGSGQDAATGITPLANWTSRLEVDFGTRTAGVYTHDTIGTTDVTAGWTQTADDAVAIAVAVTESATVGDRRAEVSWAEIEVPSLSGGGGGAVSGDVQLLGFAPYGDTTLQSYHTRYDLQILHPHVNPEQNLALAPQIRAIDPNIKLVLYELPQRGVGWQTQWNTINANESWFLHNPTDSLTAAARVRRYETPSEIYNIMDMSSAAYRAFMIQWILDKINQYGLDGFFNDGPNLVMSLRGLSWIVAPTTAQMDAQAAKQVTWFSELRTALGTKLSIANASHNYDRGFSEDDPSPIYPYVDGVMMEGLGHGSWQPGTENGYTGAAWTFQQTRYQAMLDNGVFMFAAAGTNGGTTAERLAHATYAFTSYLLKADGKSYFGETFDQISLMESAIGQPTGTAFQEASGLWRRDFTGGYVRLNSTGGTLDGIDVARGEVVLTPPTSPRAVDVFWAEIEVPEVAANRAAEVSFAEIEVPELGSRSADLYWAEIEVPDVGVTPDPDTFPTGPSEASILFPGTAIVPEAAEFPTGGSSYPITPTFPT